MSLFSWQEGAWSQLTKNNKMHHAYLFVGASGAGLEKFASTFAQSLICNKLKDTNEPCGICQDCQWLLTEHPNLQVIDNSAEDSSSNNISIESIRNLKRFFELSSHQIGGNKVILINNAESLTLNAANALLKILEEPPENSYLILTTNSISALLPTIISRCLIVSCPKPTNEEARQFLKLEGHENLSSQLPLFNNLPLDLIANQSENELFETIIEEFKKGKDFELMTIESKWLSGDFSAIISLFQKWIYDIFLFKLTTKSHFFEHKKENIKKLSNNTDISKLIRLVKSVNNIKLISNKPINKELAFDNLMIEYKNIFK